MPDGAGDGFAHRCGIPRVPAAGDAGARDHREHRLVVGGRHAADGLAEVGVEIDGDHGPPTVLRRPVSAARCGARARPVRDPPQAAEPDGSVSAWPERAESRDAHEVRLSDGTLARVVPSAYGGGWELVVDGTPQSHVDLDDPTHLHFEYIARMGAVIDRLRMPGQPLTAVHLGAGAMTIPRYVEATRPGSRQQVIELEPALIDLVREQLPLPKGASLRVRIGDAREGLGRLPAGLVGNVDLLVSDVYSGAQTPAHLTTVEFYTAAARLLAPTACCWSTSPTAPDSRSPAARWPPCAPSSSMSSCSPRCRRSRDAGSATS